jgi:hypothetical protein
MISFVRNLSMAACLAALSLPAAAGVANIWTNDTYTDTGALGQTWTVSWSGWNAYEMGSDVAIDGPDLGYSFRSPRAGDAYNGTPTQTYVFATTAAQSGDLALVINLSSNGLWANSATDMYIWQGDTDHKTRLAGATDDAVERADVTLNLTAGQAWGFMAVSGSIGDDTHYSGNLYGNFNVTAAGPSGDVPEPASLALLGLGALGAIAARRRKG